MLKVDKSNDRIVITGNPLFLCMCLICGVMICTALKEFIFDNLFLSGEEFGPFDIFGAVFLCVWTGLVLWMGVYSFLNFVKTITVCNDGVVCSVLFRKRTLTWSEIEDYGLSFFGHNRDGTSMYLIYFSAERQKIKTGRGKKTEKKKLNRNVLKILVFGSDYENILHTVIPFCRERGHVAPFIENEA